LDYDPRDVLLEGANVVTRKSGPCPKQKIFLRMSSSIEVHIRSILN
jgi:hypothetical protein